MQRLVMECNLLTISMVTFFKDLRSNSSYQRLCVLIRLLEDLSSLDFVSTIVIVDNSPQPFLKNQVKIIAPKILYKWNMGSNIGFGRGHNMSRLFLPNHKYHLKINPDIVIMNSQTIKGLIKVLESSRDLVMVQPLVIHPSSRKVQYLCKKDPTLMAMFLRSPICPEYFRYLFANYLANFEMRSVAYKLTPVSSTYLSGAFMLFKRTVLDLIDWFDEGFFLYLEDADITRRASAHGKCLHLPTYSIGHIWAKESHKSFRLFLVAVHSFLIYSRRWGLKVF
jgi:GT2 family glycosyltransferase